jgi:hypothetical protein
MSEQDPIPPPAKPAPPMRPPIQMVPPYAAPSGPRSAAETVIPTRNPDSLVSYYLGLFAIIPAFGLVAGPIAFVKGRRALKFARANADVGGKTHAAVGIGCGLIGFLFNLAILLFILALIFFGRPSPNGGVML